MTTDPMRSARAVPVAIRALVALVLYLWVLVVNSAVPGWLGPPPGVPLWHLGFATSLAHGSVVDLHAHDIGLPGPTPQSFGLPGALVVSWLLRAGLPGADAYTLGYAGLLALAFAGAVAFGRRLGAGILLSVLGAATWLTLPVVWTNAQYAMLGIGMALLPAYCWSAMKLLDPATSLPVRGGLFAFAAIVSAFTDGYTFVMFAAASAAFIVHAAAAHGRSWALARRVAVLAVSFGAAYLLYNAYFFSEVERRPGLVTFRASGADLLFFVSPPQGLLWLADLAGVSGDRSIDRWFGNPSVSASTFIAPVVVVGVALTLLTRADRRLQLVLLMIGVAALYLSLGPSFKIADPRPAGWEFRGNMPASMAHGPTGTALVWEHVPGFNAMRAVYRWVALAALGFWGAAMTSLADDRFRRIGVAALVGVMALNTPHLPTSVPRAAEHHDAARAAEQALRAEGRSFAAGERVLFLPVGNDFLVTWLAPLADIRAYNMGGDKNARIAQQNWPDDLQPLREVSSPSDTARQLRHALAKGTVDAVALSRIDLLAGAHLWPPPAQAAGVNTQTLAVLTTSDDIRVQRSRYFDIVRLKPSSGRTRPFA